MAHTWFPEHDDTVFTAVHQQEILRRIEANILPENDRSIALVTRLGFELEGISRRYQQIDGQWADHLHFVRLADGPINVSPGEPLLASERVLVRPLLWGTANR
jgi:hypothetical protein